MARGGGTGDRYATGHALWGVRTGWMIDFAGTSIGLLATVVVSRLLLVANEASELLYAGSDEAG